MKRFAKSDLNPVVMFDSPLVKQIADEFRICIVNHPVDPADPRGPWKAGLKVAELTRPLGDDDMGKMVPGVVYKYRLDAKSKRDHYCMVGSDGSAKVYSPPVSTRWDETEGEWC